MSNVLQAPVVSGPYHDKRGGRRPWTVTIFTGEHVTTERFFERHQAQEFADAIRKGTT